MIFPLFKAGLRANWGLWLVFSLVLLMYISIMISMYDPDNIDAMVQMYELLPQGMIDAFGFAETPTDLVTFVALYYYGFIILLFPLIFCIILANRLVAGLVDRGSMAYLLATPHSRVKIIVTQALFMVSAVVSLLVVNMLAGLFFSEALFPEELYLGAYLRLNLVTIFMTLAIGSICFFFSCLFNESRHALAFGGGVPLFFFAVNMLRNVGDNTDWLRYLTLYSLYNPMELAMDSSFPGGTLLVFALIGIVLYSLGPLIFSRRNLYL